MDDNTIKALQYISAIAASLSPVIVALINRKKVQGVRPRRSGRGK